MVAASSASGDPVSDLQVADVQVSEDGTPRSLVFFRYDPHPVNSAIKRHRGQRHTCSGLSDTCSRNSASVSLIVPHFVHRSRYPLYLVSRGGRIIPRSDLLSRIIFRHLSKVLVVSFPLLRGR